jgi:hypothetical protein
MSLPLVMHWRAQDEEGVGRRNQRGSHSLCVNILPSVVIVLANGFAEEISSAVPNGERVSEVSNDVSNELIVKRDGSCNL